MKYKITALLALSSLMLFVVTGAFGESDASAFRVSESAIPDGVVLTITSTYDAEFTTTIDCKLENAKCSTPLPLTTDSAGRYSFPLIEIKRVNQTLPWKYSYQFHCKPGARRNETTNAYVYSLPFPNQMRLPVLQGRFGKFSHFTGSQDEYAVDWKAPEGTPVCAARAGVVTGLRQDFADGGSDLKYRGKSNYIIVRHDDGTFAEYLHLQPNQALVSAGQKVNEGQPLARSGNTGLSSTPHIHFAVFQTVDGNLRKTLPCRFRTKGGVIESPKEGVSY